MINIYQRPTVKSYQMSVLSLLILFPWEMSEGSVGCCAKLPFGTQNSSRYLQWQNSYQIIFVLLWGTKLLATEEIAL